MLMLLGTICGIYVYLFCMRDTSFGVIHISFLFFILPFFFGNNKRSSSNVPFPLTFYVNVAWVESPWHLSDVFCMMDTSIGVILISFIFFIFLFLWQ